MITKVIFLDIDGPMISGRAAYLPDQTYIHSVFDPCATAMLLRLIENSGARIVISSTHGKKGYDHIKQLFESNGVNPNLLHPDWVTPKKLTSWRIHEISWWLQDHPEVTSYVAIDDEQLNVKYVANSVQCDTYEGFSFRNFLECCLYLDAFSGKPEEVDNKRKEATQMIQFAKRKEIWRTVRCEEPNQHRVWAIADELFPPIKNV